MSGDSASQRPRAIVEATLRLNSADQIAGTVTPSGGAQRPFFGWLELMDALEELRGAAREEPLAGAPD